MLRGPKKIKTLRVKKNDNPVKKVLDIS